MAATMKNIIINWPNRLVLEEVECVHEIIEKTCRKYPNEIAIQDSVGTMTYAELNKMSSALALRLKRVKVRPEVIVPLIFHGSRWCAVAMLGVMKAGGAFVLLNSTHPHKLLKNICAQVNATLILTSISNCVTASHLAKGGETELIVIEVSEMTMTGEDSVSSEAPTLTSMDDGPTVKAKNALYAVFTSGTTGQPKGIVVEHQAVSISIQKTSDPIYLDPSARVGQFASHSFDASVYNYLFTLAAGACLCIPPYYDMSRVTDDLVDLRVNWVLLPPSVARLVNPCKVPDLRILALGGERIEQTDIEAWRYENSEVRVLGLYGPAEFVYSATITDFGVSWEKNQWEANYLGYNPTASCWVVHQTDPTKLVFSDVGELVLGGPCLSREYVNRKSSSYFKLPWIQQTDVLDHLQRAYRTGDLVEITSDRDNKHHLRFVGRKDHQFKLYGQLVRPDQVEKHIRDQMEDATQVKVMKIHVNQADRLVGFVKIMRQQRREAEAALIKATERLREFLPLYLVPILRLVEDIPLTPNGKADFDLLGKELASCLYAEEGCNS